MTDGSILFTPSRERVFTTNAWAFLHWLATARGTHLADWASLQRWSVTEPAAFADAVRWFATLPDDAGPAWVREEAAVLLHLDLRPDDTLLVADGEDWSAAARHGATIVRHAGPAETLLHAAAGARTSVLIAPAALFDRATFRLAAGRHDLAPLRQIVALGGPMAAGVRARFYTWVKPDLMLLARAGGTVWGDPLSPVLRSPPPQPALGASLRRPPSPDPGEP